MPDYKSPDEFVGTDVTSDHDVFMYVTLGAEGLLVLLSLLPILVVLCYKRSSERLSIDRLVVALSVTDILSVIVPAPIGLTSYVRRRWVGGSAACEVYQLSSTCFQLTSMCLITLMCIDRCLTLRTTLLSHHLTPSSSRQPTIIIERPRCWSPTTTYVILIYILCLLVSCLPLLGLAPPAYSSSRGTCQSWISAESTQMRTHIFPAVFLTIGFSNLIVTLIVNVFLIKMLWKLSGLQCWSQLTQKPVLLGSDIAQKSVKEISIMTAAVTAVFYIAWLPALVGIIIFDTTSTHVRVVIYVVCYIRHNVCSI